MLSMLYQKFVELSRNQLQLCDYGDKNKVAKHNLIQKQLLRVQGEIIDNEPDTLLLLLQNTDDIVRLNAASGCFCSSIYLNEAQDVLISLAEKTNNPNIRFNACVLLKKQKATSSKDVGGSSCVPSSHQ